MSLVYHVCVVWELGVQGYLLTDDRHDVNASPIFVTLNAQDWIPAETKARLLEWKIRMDLLQYAARGVPELSVEKLAGYQPKKPETGGSLEGMAAQPSTPSVAADSSTTEIIARLHTFLDDGHAIKLGRATVVCHNLCKKYEDAGSKWLKIKGDDVWKNICHLIVDSVEAPGDHWVRSAGFDEAWKVCSVIRMAKLGKLTGTEHAGRLVPAEAVRGLEPVAAARRTSSGGKHKMLLGATPGQARGIDLYSERLPMPAYSSPIHSSSLSMSSCMISCIVTSFDEGSDFIPWSSTPPSSPLAGLSLAWPSR